jgi:5-methylcytosine-specific restriction endonuclease McrA
MRGGGGPPRAARPTRLNFNPPATNNRPTSTLRSGVLASSYYERREERSSNNTYHSSKEGTRAEEPAYGPEWEAVRKIVIRRDNYTCTNANCRKVFMPPNHGKLDVHHIIRREKGGPDTANNLRTLCKPCHALEHKHLSKIGYGTNNVGRRKKYR